MSMRDRTNAAAPATDVLNLPPRFPELPAEILARFPTAETYDSNIARWWKGVQTELSETRAYTSDVINQNKQGFENLTLTVGDLTASITEVNELIVTEVEAISRRIVTVSAMAGISTNITVSNTAPVGPGLNDYWINPSDPETPVTSKWDGSNWIEVEEPISFAGVADEREARATADGFLSGKYTLSVIAGDIATGFNITSASGPGVNISDVTFRADSFKIYSGTTKKVMFVSDAISDTVKLADTLVVDRAAGSLYIGAGIYGGATTPWYVDNLGRMSLNDKFMWDGSTLTIVGDIDATGGTIGGFAIGATTLIAGTGNDYFEVRTSAGSPGIMLGDYITGGTVQAILNKNQLSFSSSAGPKAYLGEDSVPDEESGLLELFNGTTATVRMRGVDGTIDALGYLAGGVAGITTSVPNGLGDTLNFTNGILTSVT